MLQFPNDPKKSLLSVLLAVVVFVTVIGQLFVPSAAYATIPTLVTGDVVSTGFRVKDEILQGVKTAVLTAAGVAVSHVLKKLTYESAVWLASGGKGQTPFADTKTFGNFLTDTLNDAGGRAIEELGRGTGFNLCHIPDVKTDLALRVGLRLSFNPTPSDITKKPSCTFTDFQKNWSSDAWKSKYGDTFSGASIEKQFNSSLDVNQTGLGIGLSGAEKIRDKIAAAVGGAAGERIANQGFNAKLSKISNQIQIPAQVIGEEFKQNTPGKESQKNQDQIEAAITSGDFKALPKALVTFFANTLAGTVIKNFQEKGVLPFGACIGEIGGEKCKNRADFAGNFEYGGVLGSRQAAEALFSEYLAVKIRSVDEYNILSQLSNCPDAPGLYNCRADDGLVQAAQSSDANDPVTIAEALQKGWLHPNWQLIPPSRISENTGKNCFSNMYCYSNIKVLRQVRLLPLGFEIAALNSDPDKPSTLGEVVAGFNDCDYRNGEIIYDPINHPFCHLIDPNWVIKASPMRCNAVVYGSTVLTQGIPDRLEECADLSSCVGYNKDGTCMSYGYCTREKNTWRINADQCDPQFRTCRSFTGQDGVDKGYIYSTLDTGSCTKDNSGCRAYSLSQANGRWQAPALPTADGGYINNSVYLNQSVSKSCSAQSAGCSVFKLSATGVGAVAPNSFLYLRKAPEYLKCYDVNPATAAIEWPKTRADLARIQANPLCAQYAGVCIPDEVSCNWYTPTLGGGGRIPGRFEAAEVVNNQIVWNDQCDAKCVGYASFRELPTNYSLGENLSYIIPSSGQICQAADEGCSSFTNLNTTSNDVESVEYFSYLRTCALPNAATDKNFITYEGSTVGGYQIKTFTLVKDAGGAPKYWYRLPTDLARYDEICSESLYKKGAADPDCRQFNDEQGEVYYRLLSKVIPVSQACTPYRLNNTELQPVAEFDQASCQAQKGFWNGSSCSLCLQGGEYKDGSCFYYGLPGATASQAGSSRTCAAAANTCRAYKGNTGNNIRQVINDTFESASAAAALSGWGPATVSLSTESTHVGERSLGYIGVDPVVKSLTLTPGKSYELSFWAKGDAQSIAVSLKSSDGSFSREFGTVGVGDTWNLFRMGPIELLGNSTSTQLSFKNLSNGKLYLDNVRLVEVTSYAYLVKNTLSVNALCDSSPSDNLPGEALGCREYKDPQNKSFYLNNFSYLCREGAIGCSAMLDTYNTPQDPGPSAFNIWLSGAGGQVVQAKVGTDTYSCQVVVGKTGCYVNIFNYQMAEITAALGAKAVVSSTIFIPSDTPENTPLYLVANQASSCTQSDLGCVNVGEPVASALGPQFVTGTIKNDPSLYETALCQSEAVGCSTFTDSNGAETYFKDPGLTDQKMCVYKSAVTINGARVNGWFEKDIGVCSDNRNQKCQVASDCGGEATCINIGTQPCYPNYFQEGGTYGLWSYGDAGKYENFVGECPVEQDRCTEFVDHNDNNKAYYYLKNQKISAGDCDGQVSEREGCALFEQTDNPNRYWLTQESYKASENINFAKVAPVVAPLAADNDSNILIKVQRDRECGEWLQCRSSHRVWDEKKGAWKNVCDSIGRCNKLPENSAESSITNCANWLEDSPADSNQFAGRVLEPQSYITRDISWRGMDFDGFSLLGLFPIEEGEQINISEDGANPKWRLAKPIACGGVNCADPAQPNDSACLAKSDDNTCGRDRSGTCVNKECIKNLDNTSLIGSKSTATEFYTNKIPTQNCRAYPEKDSPFPNLLQVNGRSSANQFEGVNICNETREPSADPDVANLCDCDYTKATFGDLGTRYWNYNLPDNKGPTVIGNTFKGQQLPPGICQGGGTGIDGKMCASDDDCVAAGKQAGVCNKLTKESRLLGWRGFCLEDDLSRNVNGDNRLHPCLTWLPIDFLAGTADINNQYTKAGYETPEKGGRFYCVEANQAGGSGEGDKNWPNDTFNSNHYIKVRYQGNLLEFGNDFNYTPNLYGVPSGEFSRGQFAFNKDSEVLAAGALFDRSYSPIKKQDIDQIIFNVISGDSEDIKAGTSLSIWPNAPMQVNGNGFQAAYTVQTNDGLAPGIAVTGRYLGKDNEFILFYGSRKSEDEKQFVDVSGNLFDEADDKDGLTGNLFARGGVLKVRSQTTDTNGIWDRSRIANFNRNVCYKSTDGNWHAIRVVFKPNGDFDHYDTAYCDDSPSEGVVKYEVVFKLRQWCHTLADAIYDPQSLSPNRTIAATDRLWKGSGYQHDKKIGIDQVVSAFGSLSIKNFTFPLDPLVMTSFLYQGGADDCKIGGAMPPGIDACRFGQAIVDPGKRDGGVMFDGKEGPSASAPYDKLRLASGSAYSCYPQGMNICVDIEETGAEKNNYTTGQWDRSYANFYLAKIFPRLKGYNNYDFTQGKYIPSAPSGANQDNGVQDTQVINNDTTEIGQYKAPLVFPLKDTCLNDAQCLEDNAEPGITINSESRRSVRYFTSSAKTILKFFGFADSNQMPLRSISIDWGDGTKPYTSTGLYQNQRGLMPATCNVSTRTCEVKQILEERIEENINTPCITPGAKYNPVTAHCELVRPTGAAIKCISDDDCKPVSYCFSEGEAAKYGFGHIEGRTCSNGYFQFDHTYRCTTTKKDSDGNLVYKSSPLDCPGGAGQYPNGCCLFRPKVQIKDNWGWCNGSCNGPQQGCYDKSWKTDSLGIPTGKNDCIVNNKNAWTSFGSINTPAYVVLPPASTGQ